MCRLVAPWLFYFVSFINPVDSGLRSILVFLARKPALNSGWVCGPFGESDPLEFVAGIRAGDTRLHLQRLDHAEAERLVAGLDVGHIPVSQQVAEERERPVRQVVIEIEHSRRPADHETAAVDDVGVAVEDRADHGGDLGGVVFVVGILDDNDLAGRRGSGA